MTTQPPSPDRRSFLKWSAAGAALAALGGGGLAGGCKSAGGGAAGGAGGVAVAGRRRAARIAHLTDIHVKPELGAAEGMTTCLKHVAAQPDKPDLILTGGDLVFDTYEAPYERSKALWELFTSTCRDHAPCPVEHTLGNHDIWGWNKSKSKTTGTERGWGKKWALESLGLPAPYRTFDLAGWRVVVLDSIQPGEDTGYIARLDDEQMDWLTRALASTDPRTPVMIVSHVPIIAACTFFDSREKEKKDKAWNVPGGNMHIDARDLRDLFRKHANVRLCLSGHIHQLDRVEYDGVTYICDGAVSGGWWKGPHEGCAEGYGVVDLFDDGTFEHQYVTYGWRART